ncbi:MAG: hypothetical protein ACOX1V_03840 [Candidatus Iainarchaeum sp.]|jgi:hypothetical protein|nr:MAG: hypothetical protein BWY55_00692 [archaeon ADurb.Bin336]
MVQDFVSANSIDAKVVSFQKEVSVEKVLALNNLSTSSFAKAVPFVDDKMNIFVLIKIASEKEDISFAEDIFDKNLNPIDSKTIEKITGFKKNFFPPISVLGAKMEFTPLAKKQKQLVFSLSEKEYLIIGVDGIKKSQEISDSFF